jgi:hypothetical protein
MSFLGGDDFSKHRGVPHWVSCRYGQAVKSPLTRNWLSTAVLAHKYVPHSFQELKEVSHGPGLNCHWPIVDSSRDWYEPPLKGTPLGGVLASLSAVCTVRLSTSPIITARGETPNSDWLNSERMRRKVILRRVKIYVGKLSVGHWLNLW